MDRIGDENGELEKKVYIFDFEVEFKVIYLFKIVEQVYSLCDKLVAQSANCQKVSPISCE